MYGNVIGLSSISRKPTYTSDFSSIRSYTLYFSGSFLTLSSSETYRRFPNQCPFASQILTSVQNPEPAVRTLAIFGLGLTCVLDRGLARKYLPLFVHISQVDHVAIRVTALKCIFDCYLVFGIETFLVS